jgi:hypothetical protein
MKKDKTLLLFLFLVFFLFGCKKEEEKLMRGRIIDAYSKLPLDSVSLYLYEYDKSTIPYTVTVYNDTISNTMGYYNFNFYKPKTFVTAFKNKYYNSAEYEVEYFLYDEKTIELHPYMYVNVRAINLEKKWTSVSIYATDNTRGGVSYGIAFDRDKTLDSTVRGLQIHGDYNVLGYLLGGFSATGEYIVEYRTVPIKPIPTDTIDVTITF